MKTFKTYAAFLEKYQVRTSRTSTRLTNWKHKLVERTPELIYEGKVSPDKEELVSNFCRTFWEMQDADGNVNLARYERELKDAVEAAMLKVEADWGKKLAKQISKL